MPRLVHFLLVLPALSACSATALDRRQAGVSDVDCISRLYEPPTRVAPFPVAVDSCVGRRPADLTGARYYQVLARSLNLPYVAHDKPGTDFIMLTGSRIPYPTNTPAAPELRLE